MQEDGLRGSKYGAQVLEVRQLAALVQYDELLEEGTDEDGRQIKLTEYVAHSGIFPVPAPPPPDWLETVELESPLEVLHEDGWYATRHAPRTSPPISPFAPSLTAAALTAAPLTAAALTAAGGPSSSSGSRRRRA